MNQSKKILLQPFKLGNLQLKNSFIMAPLTRCRSDPKDSIPNDLMLEYYTQRATFGCIITECSQISELSNAFPGSGGMYNREQMLAWKKIVDAVHAKDAKIIHQIWHSGRAAVSAFLGGRKPVSSSPIAIDEIHPYTQQPYDVPEELTKEGIKAIVEEFRQTALLSKEAGFDGVQLHSANSYLIDQFMRDGVNKRTDEYGGSIENRSRFLFEVLDAVASVFGYERTSVRFSPTGRYGDMYDSNPLELYSYILKELEKKNIHFVEFKRHAKDEAGKHIDPNDPTKDLKGKTLPELQIPNFFETLRPLYKGIIIGNDGIDLKEAEDLISKGTVDGVAFGRLALSNPDLPFRYEHGYELNQTDYTTLFQGGPKGYTDYPTYQQLQEQKKN